MTRMVGALGWHGQCACCCGRDAKSTIKVQEERQWRAEAEDELADEGSAPTNKGGGRKVPNQSIGLGSALTGNNTRPLTQMVAWLAVTA